MSRLDANLVEKAVKALLKFDEKRKGEAKSALIADYAKPLNAQIQLKNDVPNPVLKPVRVRLPNTIFNPTGTEEHSVCLFCRSDDKDAITEFLEKNPDAVPGLDSSVESSIISINDLKKYFKEFKHLKALNSKFSHFLVDGRVMSQVYSLLGKSFGSRNNYPVPIDFQHVDKLPAAAHKALHASTYIHLKGKCINVRLGNTNMSVSKLTENAMKGLDFAIGEKLSKGWTTVHSITLKISDSASLPIYSKDVNDSGIKFLKEAGAGNGTSSSSKSKSSKNDSSSSSNKKKQETPVTKSKEKSGSKRSREESESEEDVPVPVTATKTKKVKVAAEIVASPAPLKTGAKKVAKGIVVNKKKATSVETPKKDDADIPPPPPTTGKKKHERTPEGAIVRKSSRVRK
jgi:hypothetical protein